MSLIASAKGGADFKPHPVGVFPSRCTRIIDLGTQETTFQGKLKKSRKIVIGWETSELMGDDAGDFAGKPMLISNKYGLNLSPKGSLRPALEAWRGRKFTAAELDGFDLKNVLGKPCLLNIVHSDPNAEGKVFANISSIMPLPNGMTANQAVGELIFFSLNDFDQGVFDKLSEYLRGVIAKSDEYKAMFDKPQRPPAKTPALDDDDIPF